MKKIFITHVVFLTCSLLSWSASQEQQDAPTTTASTTSQREPTLEELIRGWLSTFRPDTPKSLTPQERAKALGLSCFSQEREKASGLSHSRLRFNVDDPSAFFSTIPTETTVLDLTQTRFPRGFPRLLSSLICNLTRIVELRMDYPLREFSNPNNTLKGELYLLTENFPPSLRTLQISGFELTKEDIDSLFRSIPKELKLLNLSHTKIRDSFFPRDLSATDPALDSLEDLNLSRNLNFWENDCENFLAKLLKRTPNLKNLNLSNSFTDCPLSVISAICRLEKLESLNLSNTFINAEALKALQGKLSSLEKLYFSRTIQPTGEGESIPLLLDFIKSLLNLDTLEVEDIGFTDAHTGKIIEALTELRKLKTVNLMLSLLTVQGIQTLEPYCQTVTLSVETNNPRENYGTSL